MTAVAVICIAVLALAPSVAFASLIRSLIRQHARERELLLNQIMHLAGRTWTPPPADQWDPHDGDAGFPGLWDPAQHVED